MGLIRVFKETVGGVLEDQWRDFYTSDSLDQDVLMTRGVRDQSKRSKNKGDESIITDGSIITVADGQFMILTDQGRIVEFSGEPGEFLYDSSTEASLFYNVDGLGDSIKRSFQNAVRRFTFGGHHAKDLRIYYINTKEIPDNKYGTPNPVPFKIQDPSIGLSMVMPIRAHGIFSYYIANPILFYSFVAGNVKDRYTREELDGRLRGEFLTALQPALARISAQGIGYDELPLHTREITKALNEELSEEWQEKRGIQIFTVTMDSVTASEEDVKRLQELQAQAVYRDTSMAAAGMTAAQMEAMKNAAKNEGGGGAFFGFAGMNMAQMAGGQSAGNLHQLAAEQRAQQAAAQPAAAGGVATAPPAEETWTCTNCQYQNKKAAKFCANCGTARPGPAADAGGWICTECGHKDNTGKFCSECGSPRPAKTEYQCSNCGWEPEDNTNPPKFCPECGDPFGDEDKKQ